MDSLIFSLKGKIDVFILRLLELNEDMSSVQQVIFDLLPLPIAEKIVPYIRPKYFTIEHTFRLTDEKAVTVMIRSCKKDFVSGAFFPRLENVTSDYAEINLDKTIISREVAFVGCQALFRICLIKNEYGYMFAASRRPGTVAIYEYSEIYSTDNDLLPKGEIRYSTQKITTSILWDDRSFMLTDISAHLCGEDYSSFLESVREVNATDDSLFLIPNLKERLPHTQLGKFLDLEL